eukprot:GILK01002914.1.p1 GENE.GILK01002914.1~~GILK01002914.1.p1  ORF type:complete len:271 (-),score=54.77 GILK01002914.1:183-995(-)
MNSMELEVLNELVACSVGSLFFQSTFAEVTKAMIFMGPQRSDDSPRSPTRPKQSVLSSSKPQTDDVDLMDEDDIGFMSNSSSSSTPVDRVWIDKQAVVLLREAAARLHLDLDNVQKSEVSAWTFSELAEEKRKVKNELKTYDNTFKKSHQRLPSREEKEPMRPIYQYYRQVKQMLNIKQYEEREHTDGKPRGKSSKTTPAAVSSSLPKSQIAQLLMEKDALRSQLHEYEKEFMKIHHRRIRYHKDILPVEAAYAKYKDLKAELERLGIRK